MMKQTIQQKVIPLKLEHKRLLLTIFKQGYITEAQRQEISSLLEVEANAMFFVYNKEQLEEIKRIKDEITDDMVRKNQLPDGYVSFNGYPTDEEINEALNNDL